jgi:hypothetical protein
VRAWVDGEQVGYSQVRVCQQSLRLQMSSTKYRTGDNQVTTSDVKATIGDNKSINRATTERQQGALTRATIRQRSPQACPGGAGAEVLRRAAPARRPRRSLSGIPRGVHPCASRIFHPVTTSSYQILTFYIPRNGGREKRLGEERRTISRLVHSERDCEHASGGFRMMVAVATAVMRAGAT